MQLDLTGGAERRAPQPMRRYGLHDAVAPQLLALQLDPDRPVLAVDADEVLVHFARHLQRFMAAKGFLLDLSAYRLDGAVTRASDGLEATAQEFRALFNGFFREEVGRQELVAGAAETLRALAEDPEVSAQVLVLTNVPQAQRAARIANLAAQGVDYPLVANVGGKGRALRFLWDHTRGPVVFIDDSAHQLSSAETRAPGVRRVHFVADPDLRRVAGSVAAADYRMTDWESDRLLLKRVLQG